MFHAVGLKTKTPRGVWALRGVTVAVALVVILVVGTVAFSAYEDFTAVRTELSGGGGAKGSAVYDQATDSETISINITVPNRGLYTLDVTVSCDTTGGVSCETAQVSVPPSQSETLHFQMKVANVTQFTSNSRVNGTVLISLDPFASITVGTNFAGFVQKPGGA